MKTIIAVSMLATSAFAAEQTWKGEITDSMCGANHGAMSGGKPVNAHDCTMACAKAGAKFAFLSGGKVFQIANQDFAGISQSAGAPVTLTGEVGADGKTITVSKVAAAR
jgi:hypothetical protein